jgi:uncharacterized protein YndB with AHSA1/START domain
MGVTSVDKDYDNLTTTLVADFDAPIDEVWRLWADPRELERWWGPPTYPATFEKHDLSPGGEVTYFMTGPEGDQSRGWWRVTSVDPPTSMQFTDGFANDDGTPNEEMPVIDVEVRLSEGDAGTRMEIRSTYHSREEMDKLIEMGALEGLRQSVGQMDALLTAGTSPSSAP